MDYSWTPVAFLLYGEAFCVPLFMEDYNCIDPIAKEHWLILKYLFNGSFSHRLRYRLLY